MADPIKIKILVNKGREGISLSRLPKLLANIQQFLDSLTEDTVGKKTEWLGFNFYNSSLGYTAETVDTVDAAKAEDFDNTLRGIVQNKPDPKVRKSTLAQYTEISHPLGLGDTVAFGVAQSLTAGEPLASETRATEWLDYDPDTAKKLLPVEIIPVRAMGSVQGRMHSVFLGTPGHFQLRELSSGELVRCDYDDKDYPEVVNALEKRNSVTHVFGMIFTDLAARKILRVKVTGIEVSPVLSLDVLDKFTGCAPGLIEPKDLQDWINRERDRAEESIH